MFDVADSLLREHTQLFLDIGRATKIAEVTLSGTHLGILWKQPFRVEHNSTPKPVANELEVSVTNLWPNRLIGDQFLPEDRRFTRTNVTKFTRESPLMASGLLGPVRILCAEQAEAKFSGRFIGGYN